jgi:hypothetical protein
MMIIVPQGFQNNPAVDRKFKELIEFMNRLEQDLAYPNCSGYEDQRQVLARAENELIMRGVL